MTRGGLYFDSRELVGTVMVGFRLLFSTVIRFLPTAIVLIADKYFRSNKLQQTG